MYDFIMEEAAAVTGIEIVNPTITTNITYKKLMRAMGIVSLGIVTFLFVSLIIIYFLARSFILSSQPMVEAISSGNIETTRLEIANAKSSLHSLKVGYRFVAWTGLIPVLGNYTKDLGSFINISESGILLIEKALPSFETNLGILQTISTDQSLIDEARIKYLSLVLPQMAAGLEDMGSEIEAMQEQTRRINPNRYPKNVRPKMETFLGASVIFTDAAKSVKSLPYLLGLDSPRQYLILFQNDKELRPTGGFMTAYSIMKVDKIKFSPVASEDVYSLDAKYKPNALAPEPLVKYLKGPYELSPNLRLRDMNWSPDFPSSMINFKTAAGEAGVSGIDGIIAVDTQVLVNILDVIGPVGVPGFGTYSTEISPECNCPQVIHELESFADVEGPIVWDPVSGEIVYKPKNADNRKKIIGPLMNSIIASAISQPKEKIPSLFSAFVKSLAEKHVLFYLYNPDVQAILSDLGLDGKIMDYDGDYLHVNDANLGGRKSNLYVTHEVSQEIEVDSDGSVVKTVTLTYRNPAKQDGWLNSVLPNWVRVYVPKGSELVTVEGLEEKAEPYEDLGKTVFAGYFQLRPEGVSKVTFRYRLPMKMKGEYKLLMQKQPGTDKPLHTIILNGKEQEFNLNKDKEIRISI